MVLENNPDRLRYKAVSFLSPLELKMAAGAAQLVVSRAGSTLFEIASWGLPSILVPFENSQGDHSRRNAFTYAHAGACSVMEEANMTGNILSAEIDRIMEDKSVYREMSGKAKVFHRPGAAKAIAEALLGMAIAHEK